MPSTLGRRKKPDELSAPDLALTNENDDGLLPTDVLYEVLLRLLAKELCRIRLACRSWRSLTSDPGFAKAHASRHPPLVAGIWNSTEVHLLDLTCCNNIVRRLHVPQSVYDLSTDLGLLCVSLSLSPVTTGWLSYVLDPVTGEIGSFRSVLGPVPDHVSFRWSSPSVLGHVPSTGEYKALVTNGYCTGRDGLERITQTCNVITLGTVAGGGGSGKIRWRARPCPPVVVGPSCLRNRVVTDGVAYLLSDLSQSPYSYHDRKYSDGIEPDAIFAFDLATEEWRPNILRGPLSSNNSDSELKFSRMRESLQLFVLDGCLVTAHHKNLDCSMDLWFLADIDKGIWTKRYSIRCVPRCREHAYRPPFPLHVLEDGRIVIWGAEKARVLGV